MLVMRTVTLVQHIMMQIQQPALTMIHLISFPLNFVVHVAVGKLMIEQD
jgi:hypothetical protein